MQPGPVDMHCLDGEVVASVGTGLGVVVSHISVSLQSGFGQVGFWKKHNYVLIFLFLWSCLSQLCYFK